MILGLDLGCHDSAVRRRAAKTDRLRRHLPLTHCLSRSRVNDNLQLTNVFEHTNAKAVLRPIRYKLSMWELLSQDAP